MAVTWKKLAYVDDVVTKALFDEHTILYATSDNTPVALTVGASTVVGRAAAGNIVALAKSDLLTLLNVADGADVTPADVLVEGDFVAAGDLIVGTGVNTGGILSIGTAAQVLKVNAGATGLEWGAAGGGDFMANGTVPMTGDLDLNDNSPLDMVIQTVANEAAVTGYANPKVGKMLWSTAELAAYVCTSEV